MHLRPFVCTEAQFGEAIISHQVYPTGLRREVVNIVKEGIMRHVIQSQSFPFSI